MKSKKKIIALVAVIGAFILLGAAFIFGTNFFNKSTSGEKNIVISVTDSAGKVTEYAFGTDAEYLSEAMDEAAGLTYSGTEDTYGLMLEEVNGEKAVYETDGAYWAILVDGEYGLYGIDSQQIADGVEYSLVYTAA